MTLICSLPSRMSEKATKGSLHGIHSENPVENPKLERDCPPLYSQIGRWPPIYMTTDAANLRNKKKKSNSELMTLGADQKRKKKKEKKVAYVKAMGRKDREI